jgi:hypothetical protein
VIHSYINRFGDMCSRSQGGTVKNQIKLKKSILKITFEAP